jgi:hypothetical protein
MAVTRSMMLGTIALAGLVLATHAAAADAAWRPAPAGLLDGDDVAGLECTDLAVAGGVIHLAVRTADLPVARAVVVGWVGTAARAVAGLYGGAFPVAEATLVVTGEGRHPGVHDGHCQGGRLITVHLGAGTSTADLADDWIVTHEMLHLAIPDLGRSYLWMEEGAASYFEPFARARIGALSSERVWRDLVEGLPQGLPGSGDRGLDRTHTWGRTYWGGALYWLLADLDVRERTGNRQGAEQALRALRRGGADGSQHWRLADFLAVADRGLGLDTLTELHRRQGTQPASVDLPALWRRLGVVYRDGAVRFDDSAPLAAIRRAMTAAADPPDAAAPLTAPRLP